MISGKFNAMFRSCVSDSFRCRCTLSNDASMPSFAGQNTACRWINFRISEVELDRRLTGFRAAQNKQGSKFSKVSLGTIAGLGSLTPKPWTTTPSRAQCRCAVGNLKLYFTRCNLSVSHLMPRSSRYVHRLFSISNRTSAAVAIAASLAAAIAALLHFGVGNRRNLVETWSCGVLAMPKTIGFRHPRQKLLF